LGITGYLGFLDGTLGDVLNNFEPDTLEANAARGLLAITMFFTYPMEAFVARHVIVRLFFNGDMDGHDTATTTTNEFGESVRIESSWWGGWWTRRHKITLAIYVATLIPALLVNDLGSVLSITGSLGGSCLCYIGPGMVYLGIHGEAFLMYVGEVLEKYNRNTSTTFLYAATTTTRTPTIGTDDLPVEGDTTATLHTKADHLGTLLQTAPKPWWWIPLAMPLWVAIATTGSQGMQTRLLQLEQEDHDGPPVDDEEIETIGPCHRDFFISIFFICFGILAAVVGLISNIYVQLPSSN
jgi:hypothetical protein